MSDSSLAALLLTNRLVDLDAKPLSASEYWALVSRVPDPAVLLDLRARRELNVEGVLSDGELERIQTLIEGASAFAFELEQLEEEGVRVLSSFHEQFPARLQTTLGTACPAFLTVAGPIEWLGQPGLGVVGSRDASEKSLEIVAAAAQIAHERDVPVLSGLARGIDQASMTAALERRAKVLGVPAEGLRIAAKSPEIRRRVHDGELCLASPYPPSMRFTAGNAMARNKLIYALSEVALVVCADKGAGGTGEGAKEAIRKGYGTVAVWLGDGAGPGNEELVSLGATGVTTLEDLFDLGAASPEASEQARLF